MNHIFINVICLVFMIQVSGFLGEETKVSFNQVFCQNDRSLLSNEEKKVFLTCSKDMAIQIDQVNSFYIVGKLQKSLADSLSQKNLLANSCKGKAFCAIDEFILNDLSHIPTNSCLNYKIDLKCVSNNVEQSRIDLLMLCLIPLIGIVLLALFTKKTYVFKVILFWSVHFILILMSTGKGLSLILGS